MNFPNIDKLCKESKAFGFSQENDQVFFEAMEENYLFQYWKQPYIRFLSDRSGFNPSEMRKYEDVFRIPPLFVGTMKIHAFKSVADEQIIMTLTSSGTAGQKTQTFFDAPSLERLEKLSGFVFNEMGMVSSKPVHYFVFNYDRGKASDVGTAWSAEQKTKMAPAIAKYWTIEWNKQKEEFDFDIDKWVNKMLEVPTGDAVRLVGFPAFIFRFVNELIKVKPGFRVHPDSFVIAGGGWKNHAGETMTHKDFALYLEKNIGLPAENVRDTYGMAEHGIPYAACKKGFHHVPIYGRLMVRNPLGMKILPPGEEGLLQLITPFNTAQSNLSVLSTDLCILKENCTCGMPGLFISSIRRGGIRKHKGCAIAAQEILNKSQKN
ncbi:MAG: acyl-protein synthetase LuxE [Bacteroidia bacterium]|nr:acyl-protein synthetase LuxE [Bacteroidia bacterium]